MSRILYLSCHSVLEYMEVSLLHDLGHYVFSPGAYVEPRNVGDSTLRPTIPTLVYDPDDLEKFHKLGVHGGDNKDHLTKEFVDSFDIVLIMHLPRWIVNNWDAMKHKHVVWRTIGQSIAPQEQLLAKYRNAGMKVVRYSPKEYTIPHFLGQDAIIRFYLDPNEFGHWNGQTERVISFGQSMKSRDQACNFSLFENVTSGLPRKLFGPGNENVTEMECGGRVSYEELKKEMRDNRVYFYTGTHPASYTLNFMESLMTGIPVVAIGNAWGNAPYFHGHCLYEVPELITHGVNGFVSDDISELRSCVEALLKDHQLASKIGAAGREKAIELFGKDKIKEQWRQFFDTLK